MKLIIRFLNRRATFLLVCLAGFSLTYTAHADLVIDEVRPWCGPVGEGDPLPAMFEIFNGGASAVDLSDYLWRSDSLTAALPDADLPPGCYLKVILAAGTDEFDFSDSMGIYYCNAGCLTRGADELGLYYSTPDTSIIEDYIGWGIGTSSFGTAYSDAIARAIWPAGEFADLASHGLLSAIGRIPSGYDNNLASDWQEIEWTYTFTGFAHNAVQLSPPHGTLQELITTFSWRTVPGVWDYLLEIDDTAAFTSPEVSEIVPGNSYDVLLPDGEYYWRVIPQGIGNHPAAVWIVGQGSFARITWRKINIPQRYQHKDTRLLCIWDLSTNTRPGCWHSAGWHGPWDSTHSQTAWHIENCPHCSQYCARASIQMINAHYGGSLTQDEISYRMMEDNIAGRPEGDLGHNTPASHDAGDYAAYSWALNGVATTTYYPDSMINWTTLTTEIDAGRPILSAIKPGHAVVTNGYYISDNGTRWIYITDPWPGKTNWYLRTAIYCYRYYTLPAGAITGRATDANISQDQDGDGVMNFDEGRPDPASGQVARTFQSKWDDDDTDNDEVPDKKEIRSYTFHDSDHGGHNNNALTFPDVDGDNLRAENDCDSDNDGDFDGGEDINGDGINPVGINETCLYAGENEISVNVLVIQGPFWGQALLYARTLHANAGYPYEILGGCPTLQDSDVISWNGGVSTDAGGIVDWQSIGTYPPGLYLVVLDILRDNYYSTPDNWDPWTCFSVAAPPPITGVVIQLDPILTVIRVLWPFQYDAWRYRVYAGMTPDFPCDTAHFVTFTHDTSFTEYSLPFGRRFYAVTADYGYEREGMTSGSRIPDELRMWISKQTDPDIIKAELSRRNISCELYRR